jgi:hypothetical protein
MSMWLFANAQQIRSEEAFIFEEDRKEKRGFAGFC